MRQPELQAFHQSHEAGAGATVPEGDTVYLAAKRLDNVLAGRDIDASDIRLPTLATVDLTGLQVREVRPYGKHLMFRLSDNRTLHTHFRMDGSWHIYREGQRWTGGPMHSVRIVLHSGIHVAVGYRLHDVRLVPTSRESDIIGHLGPDILDDTWDREQVRGNVRDEAARPIADVLVDQRVLAGIGNIYRCESLFLARIAPTARVGDLSDEKLESVVDIARELMMRNRDRSSQATTGDERRAHFVYGRARQRCRRCHESVRARTGTGEGTRPNEQTIFWCPGCQE
jgi:endonuclease-8